MEFIPPLSFDVGLLCKIINGFFLPEFCTGYEKNMKPSENCIKGENMKFAIVGCGYVADNYLYTLPNHPNLELAGAYDHDLDRLKKFCDFWKITSFESLDSLLADPTIQIVANLTNPRNHYEVSNACLEAGKHIYTEKPLAMTYEDANKLVQLSKKKGLYVSGAPCSLLGETAQTMWKAIREGEIGKVRLAYANLDDGMVHLSKPAQNWHSASGAPWPAKDEFEVGCTFEHAGYYLSWLAAFFGSAKRVTSFASEQIPNKGVDTDVRTPDFMVGCVEYKDSIVARVTCSIVAPVDRSLTIIGDRGILYTKEAWNYASPVFVRKWDRARWKRGLKRFCGIDLDTRYPHVRKADFIRPKTCHAMDFSRGIGELAKAIEDRQPCKLSAELNLHITEITEALQYPEQTGRPKMIQSEIDPIEPMAWA